MLSADRLFHDAADKLKETVRQGLTLDAAQIKVIGLDHIRKAAGAAWPDLSDRIRANSMDFIERCIDDDDIVLPCGDGFLVIFTNKPGLTRNIERDCMAIQDALDAFYLGEDGLRNLRARVEAQTIKSSDVAALIAPDRAPAPAPRAETWDITFVPAWSVERQAAGIYLATPIVTGSGAAHLGYDKSYRETGRHERTDFLDIDLMMLKRVASLIETRGETCGLISFSVHATTMQRRTSRSAFLGALARIPEHRRRLMLGRIAEIEPGTPVVTIADWVHQLRAFTPRVALEMHFTERAAFDFDTVGAWSIGCVLPPSSQSAGNRPLFERMIRQWAARAHRQELKCGLFGLTDPHLVDVAIEAGVDYLASPLIWPPLREPAGLRGFSNTQLRQALHHIGDRAPVAHAY